jgi:hypothetical protein
MARPIPVDLDLPGSDLFRPLFISVVGILIVLVMVVGARSHLAGPPADDLAATRQAADSLEGEVRGLAAEIETVLDETALRARARDDLAAMLTQAELDLAKRREALDAGSRKQYDLERDLALAKADLEKLEKERGQVIEAPDKTVKIENYPTPLSRPVDNQEIHFQLKQGRLAYVPFNEFKDRLKGGLFQEKAWKLKDAPEFTDTLGPVFGFNIRYTFARVDVPWEEAVRSGIGGTMIEMQLVEFLPTSSDLGEPVEEALSNKSAFRGHLDELNPKRTTVTVWVYADSFDQFRFVRKELYRLGYTVAARPKAQWDNIGGSSHGSKSAAE